MPVKNLPTVKASHTKNEKADALLILHGIFSNAGNMSRLKAAITRRGAYRRITAMNLSWGHNIPELGTINRGRELARTQLITWLKRNGITGRFDVCGHSNGGYVAMAIGACVPERVRNVFTLGTPDGLKRDYECPVDKVYHFYGDMDAIPKWIRGRCQPGNGNWIVRFIDETHSSLHLDADHNGVADFISWTNGLDKSSYFFDKSNQMHIWPHCGDAVPEKDKRQRFSTKEIILCNGIHDKNYESHKTVARNIQLAFNYGPFAKTIFYYEAISRLKGKIKILKEDESILRVDQKRCSDQIQELERSTRLIEKRIIQFEKAAAEEIQSLTSYGRKKIRSIHDPLKRAHELCRHSNFSDAELEVVVQLINDSAREHSELVHAVRSRIARGVKRVK